MRAIVTGSHGFIGGNLVKRLEAEDWEVTCFDLKIYRDMFGRYLWPEVDVIYHLACMNQMDAVDKTQDNLNINAFGARFAAAKAKKMGAKLIYTSTASVYGNAEEFPTPKTARLNPLSEYAVAKLAGENFVKISGADWLIYRLSNVYGPGQTTDNPYCGVVAKFIKATEAGKKLTIYGNGRQTRDYTYIDDVIDELIDPQYITGVKNMSHGKEISVNDLAVEVSKACGKLSTRWEEKPRPVDGIERRLLRSNVNCPTALPEGLKKTVEWYRSVEGRERRTASSKSSGPRSLSGQTL